MPLKPPPPIHWILDFDSTITTHDTLTTLVSISASNSPSFPVPNPWSALTTAYLHDYTSTLSALAPTLPTTLPGEKALLQTLRPVEQKSLTRVSSSGIFTGLTYTALLSGARKARQEGGVELRKGFEAFYEVVMMQRDGDRGGEKITILSVNWSALFIHACLPSSPPFSMKDILANELEGLSKESPDSQSTGRIVQRVVSSGDKVRELERLRREDEEEGSGKGGMIVYVGDSWTDIEALIAADLGICIRDEEMGRAQRELADALERLGIECVRLGEGGGKMDGRDNVNMVWARDWDEIRAWSEGLQS
ncbi:hypothetical protein NX059_007273 [Plenodomus lindquistii]|nr:hypothetical protein NX059_007273 [Plenodomus lindquistii]